MEECLYNTEDVIKEECEKVKEDRYFKLNGDIHILNAIPKTDLNSVYVGLHDLILKNSVKNLIVGFFSEEEIKKSVFLFSQSNNHHSYSRSFFITPQDKKLQTIVKHIKILLFDLSDDYIGICFEVNLCDKIKCELNNIINGDCLGEQEFIRYYSKKKKVVSKMNWNPNITREKKIDEYIIEIKCRVIEFLEKYLPLTNYNNKAPVSIDIYSTNYDLKNDDEYDAFLRSYNIYRHCQKEITQISTIYRYKDKGDKFVESDFLFICEEGQTKTNRSAKLIINKKNEEQEMILYDHSMINFYIIALYFYYLGDFERKLTEIRNNLYNYYNKRQNKIYSGYESTLKEIQKFKMMFNNVSLSDMEYIDDRLKGSLEFQNERFNNLIKKYDDLELSFNNKMLVSNYKSTLFLTKVSIVLSVLAIIITLYFSYRQEKDDSNKQLENAINSQTIEIEKQINMLNELIENLKN